MTVGTYVKQKLPFILAIATIVVMAGLGLSLGGVIAQAKSEQAQEESVRVMADLHQEIDHLRWLQAVYEGKAGSARDTAETANAGGLANGFMVACKDLVYIYNTHAKAVDDARLSRAGLSISLTDFYCYSGKPDDNPVEAPYDR